jgi:transcription termination factor Rho
MATPTQTEIPELKITAAKIPAPKITAPSAQQSTKPSESGMLRAVSGILDVGGNGSAFLRTSGFRIGPDDVFVPAALINQYALRRGDQIAGAAVRTG